MNKSILLLIFILIFSFVLFNYEFFCADGYIKMSAIRKSPKNSKIKELATTCCPNNGKFTFVIHGDKLSESNCCENYKKTITKKEKGRFIPLPKNKGYCTTIL